MTDAMQVAGLVGTPETLAPTTNPDLRWYIVHAYSGMEKAVERNITERINRAGMQNKFGRILVPTEEVVEMRNGKRKTTERRLFPGYVFVEMVMEANPKLAEFGVFLPMGTQVILPEIETPTQTKQTINLWD